MSPFFLPKNKDLLRRGVFTECYRISAVSHTSTTKVAKLTETPSDETIHVIDSIAVFTSHHKCVRVEYSDTDKLSRNFFDCPDALSRERAPSPEFMVRQNAIKIHFEWFPGEDNHSQQGTLTHYKYHISSCPRKKLLQPRHDSDLMPILNDQ